MVFDFEPKDSADEVYRDKAPQSPPSITPASESEVPILPISDSEVAIEDYKSMMSSVVVVEKTQPNIMTPIAPVLPATHKPQPSTSTLTPGTSAELSTLPVEILEALGNPKGREEVFGPNIPEEIAERWGRVLVDGIAKEQKPQVTEKCLIPSNFRLAKAPVLNPEILPVLTDAAENRDKLMEKSQNQLGLGILELTYLASVIIRDYMNKIEILKKISEISQIFLDLHHKDTTRKN